MLEHDIAEIMNNVGIAARPDSTELNPGVPTYTYTITSATPQPPNHQRQQSWTNYTVEIMVAARTNREVLALLLTVKNALHQYRGGNIKTSFLTNLNTTPIEEGHAGIAEFSIWYREGATLFAYAPGVGAVGLRTGGAV